MTWFLNESGRQDSNLRPSAPKALNRVFADWLVFQISNYLLFCIEVLDETRVLIFLFWLSIINLVQYYS